MLFVPTRNGVTKRKPPLETSGGFFTREKRWAKRCQPLYLLGRFGL